MGDDTIMVMETYYNNEKTDFTNVAHCQRVVKQEVPSNKDFSEQA